LTNGSWLEAESGKSGTEVEITDLNRLTLQLTRSDTILLKLTE
jgi:hypothetical protein